MSVELKNEVLYRVCEDGTSEVYDFNREYAGYYVPCIFTALCHAGGQYLLAGVDEAGSPHLFLSLQGGVWEERSLASPNPLSYVRRLTDRVVEILYEEEENQFYLICRNGEAAVLPDCPKCMRLFQLRPAGKPSDSYVTGAGMADKRGLGGPCLQLRWSDGGLQEIPLSRLRQYRVSVSFAAQLMKNGGRLIDVGRGFEGEPEEPAIRGLMGRSEKVCISQLEERLESADRRECLIFVCDTGRLADEAAEYARRHGFHRAFSLGGTKEWLHVN